jgi:hypothetical protein
MAEHGDAIFLASLALGLSVPAASFRLLSGVFDGSSAAADRAGHLPAEIAEP